MQATHPAASQPEHSLGHLHERHSTRYLVTLFIALMSATVFDGYDTAIFHLCTPDIAKTFHMSDPAIGAMATTVRFGGMLSLVVVFFADCYGRKPVISITVLAYALFTLFTALSSGVISFTVFQTCAQIFLVAEFGVAITMIAEEFPDETRGRAVSALHIVSLIGVTVAGLLYGHFVETSWGWRGLYFVGLVPLLLIAYLRRRVKETVRFNAVQAERRRITKDYSDMHLAARELYSAFTGKYCWRVVVVALLWNSIGMIGGPMISFFSLYARRDHHWTSKEVGFAIIIAYLMGAAGGLISGQLMDRFGRRITASIFYLGSAAAMVALFTVHGFEAMFSAEIATMFFYQASRAATSAISTELFPTEIRATGYSLCVQAFGQIGWALSPIIIGVSAEVMGGLGHAAALFAIGPVLGVVLIVLAVPETLGKTLEELSP
jgi:MFS transporter, putative metabolite:H+ symporter